MTEAKVGLRKALTLSFAQTWISLGLNVATIVVVSRLLTPAEIGVFSVAVGMVALMHTLREFGVSSFIVQDPTLNNETIRTVFTVNLVIAWAVALVMYALSGLAGDFYGDPGVARVTRVLCLVFMLLPFGTTPMALLKRDMRYDVLLRIRLGETVARGVITIGLVFAGFSYMSMAWASVAGMAALVIGCTVWGCGYRAPGLGLKHWRKVVHFGSSRTLSDLVGDAGSQAANIVVGKILGMAAAGLYSRGFGVVNMFQTSVVGAVSSVAYPAFAQEHRDTGSAANLYLKSLVYLCGISWPFFAVCALMAFPMIQIAFGSQWLPAVPLMRWLCIAAIMATLTYQCGNFLTAIGRYRVVTRTEVTFQSVRVGLCVAAAFHGLEAVAAVQVVVYVVAAVLYCRLLAGIPELHLRRVARALASSAGVTMASCLVPAAVLFAWPGTIQQHYVASFIVAAAGATVGWLLGIMLIGHPLTGELMQVFARVGLRFGGTRW